MKPVPRAFRSRASWQRREHACQPSEGEGNAAAYHNPQLDETELKQNRTTLLFRPKIANKQIKKLADAVGGKSRWSQNWCKPRIGRTGS